MSLEIIMGPMFSGKSSRILSIVSRYSALKIPILVIKHSADNRYAQDKVATHDGRFAPCITVSSFGVIDDNWLREFQVIIIEEAQFFEGLVRFVKYLTDDLRKNVFIVGLDGDFERQPFGEILQCIPLADRVEKLTSLCSRCSNGKEAIFTKRLIDNSNQMVVAGAEVYEAVCRNCYFNREALPTNQS